jgi:hypothetical protein
MIWGLLIMGVIEYYNGRFAILFMVIMCSYME